MDNRVLQQLNEKAPYPPLTPVDPAAAGATTHQLVADSSWPGSRELVDKAPTLHTDLYVYFRIPPWGEA